MAITPCDEIAIPPGLPSPLVSRVNVSVPPVPMFTICSVVATSCWSTVIAARSVPSGLTAKFVRKDGENVMDEPGIGSSFPEAALNPLIFPEKFPTKNLSFAAGGGGGLMEELPPLQATASATSDVAASAANFDITECFRTTSGVVSCLNPDVFGSQRMVHPFCFAPKPALDPQIRLSIGLTTQIQCCLILCDADHFTVCFHYPASHDVPQSPSNDSPQNIRHIVVSHVQR